MKAFYFGLKALLSRFLTKISGGAGPKMSERNWMAAGNTMSGQSFIKRARIETSTSRHQVPFDRRATTTTTRRAVRDDRLPKPSRHVRLASHRRGAARRWKYRPPPEAWEMLLFRETWTEPRSTRPPIYNPCQTFVPDYDPLFPQNLRRK